MVRKKLFWIVVIVLVVAVGGYAAYTTWFAPKGGSGEETTLQTATVTVGDISITASGTGVLVASSEVNLAFSSAGTLIELPVQVGDKVKAGATLGRIDDGDARNAVAAAEVQVIQAQQALDLASSQAELNVAQAEADLKTAQKDLDALLNWESDQDAIKLAKANLYSAQASYQNVVAKAGMRDDQTASVRISLDQATASLVAAQVNYTDAMNPEHDWERNIEDTRASAAAALVKAQQNLEIAQANYNLNTIDSSTADVQSAWAKVLSAKSTVEDLETQPDEAEIATARAKVQAAELALRQAQLEAQDLGDGQTSAKREAGLTLEQAQLKLESAQKTLAGTTLVAPFSGTVVQINAKVGETASGTAVVLADLDSPMVQFWVEEADMKSMAIDNPVNIVFEALPDLTYAGKIVRVDPVLVTVGNTSAVQAWASIDVSMYPVALLGDMNVEVEVVAGEARNVLLAPVQALRKLSEDQYAVFVVLDSGDLEMRLVEVGLMDFVNAEIRSGLQRGEVVSLGETTTSSSSESPTDTTPRQFDMMPFPGG